MNHNANLIEKYFNMGLEIILAKGYNVKYNPNKDYKTAKEPISFDVVNDKEKITNHIKQGGWIGWLLPNHIIAFDVDNETNKSFCLWLISKKLINTSYQKTSNGYHFFFLVDKQISNNTSLLLNSGISVTAKGGGKQSFVLIEPSEGKFWMKTLDEIQKLPKFLEPLDLNDKKQLFEAIAWQLKYMFEIGFSIGNDIDLDFVGASVYHGFDDKWILQKLQFIFGEQFDENRSQGLVERARKRFTEGQELRGLKSLKSIAEKYKNPEMLKIINRVFEIIKKETRYQVVSEKRLLEKVSIGKLRNFPINVYPVEAQNIIMEFTKFFGLKNYDMASVCFLWITGGIIGHRVEVMLNNAFKAYLNLYVATVGRSGSGKSPIVVSKDGMLQTIFKADYELYKKYIEELQIYKKEIERYNTLKKSKKANNNNLIEQPQAPKRVRYTLDDTTVEKIIDVIEENDEMPILLYIDELSSLLDSFGRYSSNKSQGDYERSVYVAGYDVRRYQKTRRTSEEKVILRPCLSILGGIQPEIFTNIPNRNIISGFSQRWLYHYFESSNIIDIDYEPNIQNIDRYNEFIHSLLGIRNSTETLYIGMTKKAREIFHNIDLEIEQLKKSIDNPFLEGWLSKEKQRILKYCGIINLIEHFFNKKELQIDADIMEKAYMVSCWFKEHTRFLWDNRYENTKVLRSDGIETGVLKTLYEMGVGFHTTQQITDKLIVTYSEITTRSVGKLITKLLKLEPMRKYGKRGYQITQSVIEQIGELLYSNYGQPKDNYEVVRTKNSLDEIDLSDETHEHTEEKITDNLDIFQTSNVEIEKFEPSTVESFNNLKIATMAIETTGVDEKKTVSLQ